MVSQIPPSPEVEVIYPDSDGQPMADNTKQFRWIVVIKENLENCFRDRADVFVAGDLLWYPVEGNNKIRQAPDVLVAIGRPKGDRGSYMQWREGNLPPQVVFEVLSPGNTRAEINRKLLFYNQYGVQEYYLYDPDTNALSGWLRRDDFLDVIDPIADWVSPMLGIRFDLSGSELRIFGPDGQLFLTYGEIAQRAEQAEERAEQAEERAEQAEERARRLEERLRAMGIDPNQV
ncbi:MAG TPA: Uma2 family endonuclease [Coleofasciculaceae cyanobacterium]